MVLMLWTFVSGAWGELYQRSSRTGDTLVGAEDVKRWL